MEVRFRPTNYELKGGSLVWLSSPQDFAEVVYDKLGTEMYDALDNIFRDYENKIIDKEEWIEYYKSIADESHVDGMNLYNGIDESIMMLTNILQDVHNAKRLNRDKLIESLIKVSRFLKERQGETNF